MQPENANNANLFSQRLKSAMDERGIGPAEVAGALTIAVSTVYRWLEGSRPQRRAMRSLAAFLRVRESWLEFGADECDVSQPDSALPKAEVLNEDAVPYGAISVRLVPVISWAHAGAATTYEELPKSWQSQVYSTCRDKRAFALTVDGDSMEPRCLNGDIVVVMPSEAPRSGCLVVAKLKDDGIVLRRFTLDGVGQIRLTPYNTIYPTTVHERDDFHWIYPVAETVRKEWS